ncbi:MAG TPA: alpha-ketoglutarate-dependent dioxygenase AlkB [Vicinamibacterales bacterium]|nr:alpha-ketoglutarate-dependent dioxygenase AlkB [Vicinamibacterales bacterium]
MPRQGSLLERPSQIEGFVYREEFVTPGDELGLLERIRALEFHEMKMRGVVARRRVLHYGVKYSFETFKATPGPPIPEFLLPLREQAGTLANVRPEALAEALITEYSAGASIGWHRDASPFGIVIGISLLSACRFRFRRGQVRAWETVDVPLPPRSAYVLSGSARSEWEHSIPAVKALRYSITFRTLR